MTNTYYPKGIVNDEKAALEWQTDNTHHSSIFKDLANIYCVRIKYEALG